MPGSRAMSAVMFWLMTAAGGAVLVPCLVLPPWIEYRGVCGQLVARQAHIASLEQRIVTLQRQIDHLRHDPAYLERLAREELAIETPGVTAGEPDAPTAEPADASPVEAGAPDASDADSLRVAFPRLASAADQAVDAFPQWVAVFLGAETRPWVLGLSCALVAAAVLLLGSPGRRRTGESGPERRVSLSTEV